MTIPSLQAESFARQAFDVILEHLRQREANESAVSRIAVGAAFEQWLAFESRLALEAARGAIQGVGIDLMERIQTPSSPSLAVHRYWLDNEVGKVDLLLGESPGTCQDGTVLAGDTGACAFEFKVIHNNKNWKARSDTFWDDIIDPPAGKYTRTLPSARRFGIAAEVFKHYPPHIVSAGGYPGQRTDAIRWRREFIDYLTAPYPQGQLEIMNLTPAPATISLNSAWLIGSDNAVRLMLCRRKP